MTCYVIAYLFRDDATAEIRRDSLVREIGRCARVWDETAGLAIVETPETLAAFEARLYLDSCLNAYKDKLLVIEMKPAAATARGIFDEAEQLRALLPDLTIA